MNQLIASSRLFQSRKTINTIYFLIPPLGILFMCLSPFFSTRERLVRSLVTASFLTFFGIMGPELQSYYNTQLAALEQQQNKH